MIRTSAFYQLYRVMYLRFRKHIFDHLYSSHNGFLACLCVRNARRQVKSEIKLSEYNCNQDLVSSPPGLSAVRTGKTENQIGFSIKSFTVNKAIISFVLVTVLLISCNRDNHKHADGEHEHLFGKETQAGGETETLAYTLYTDKSELFVEFNPLIAGKVSTVHRPCYPIRKKLQSSYRRFRNRQPDRKQGTIN